VLELDNRARLRLKRVDQVPDPEHALVYSLFESVGLALEPRVYKHDSEALGPTECRCEVLEGPGVLCLGFGVEGLGFGVSRRGPGRARDIGFRVWRYGVGVFADLIARV
jgi:hypothetical protein